MNQTLIARAFLLVMLLGAGSGAPADQAPPPALAKERGIINGYIAVAAWPAKRDSPQQPAGPAGFSVHLVPGSDPATEITKPAGEWFLPDEDRYLVWVEGNGLISSQTVLGFELREAGEEDRGRGALFPVAPAGTVVLANGVVLTKSQVVRLLGTSAGFARRVGAEAARGGVLMPQGNVIAAVYDDETQAYVAVSRPLAVHSGGTVTAAPAPPPPPLTDLLVHGVVRGMPFSAAGPVDLVAELADGTTRSPDAIVQEHNHLYGFWYGLESRAVTVRLVSKTLGAEPVSGTLPPGGVRSLEMACSKLPSLGVSLILPPGFPREHAKLQAWRRSELLAERALTTDQDRVVMEALPAALIELVLVSPPWRPKQELDLRDSMDREVDFHVDAITIRGRLDLCDSSEPTKLRLRTQGEQWAEFLTDEKGAFEAVVFQPVMLFEVIPAGRDDSIVEILPMPVDHDETIDLGLACNDYRLEVRDAESHDPVPAAKVLVANERADRPGGSSRQLACDEKGNLRLPLLRPGTLRLSVKADGYQDAAVEESVPDKKASRTIEVLLWPESSTGEMRVVLPNGQPASGARVALLSVPTDAVLWEGACDGAGIAKLPERPHATHVAAQHHAAGFAIAAWGGGATKAPQLLRLPPSRALAVSVSGPDGASRFAAIALWVNGLRLAASPLGWLTQTPPLADNTGMWRTSNLPAAEIGILAFARGRNLEARLRAGELDGMRTTLRPVEPQVIALQVVE